MKVTAVFTFWAAQRETGRGLAAELGIPHLDASAEALAKSKQIERYLRAQLASRTQEPLYIFIVTDKGLALSQLGAAECLSIRADFHGPSVRYRRQKGGGKRQMIAKAVGLGSGSDRPLRILDATAGLGRDAFVLASLGASVTLVERVPEVRALLADALAQAAEWGRTNDPELTPILERMQVVETDAIEYMQGLPGAAISPGGLRRFPGVARQSKEGTTPALLENVPDVVYLDPMFPVRSQSALVKKEMRVFHDLVGTDPDADDLLATALSCARRRVVVKRPRTAAPISSQPSPSFSLEGKSNRFDVYICV